MELTRRSFMVCKIHFSWRGFMESPSSVSHTLEKLPNSEYWDSIKFQS